MIIKCKEDLSLKDIEVLISYAYKNQTVDQLITMIKSVDKKVKCKSGEMETWKSASEIYYIESVDKRTFVYCENEVYQSELRLYQLIEELFDVGFVQTSKSCIINLKMLDYIKPLFNSRMEATLINGERVNVTRRFIPGIKERLYKEIKNT